MEQRRRLSRRVDGLASRVEQVEEAWDALHRLRQKLTSEAEALHERARRRRTTAEAEGGDWGHDWRKGREKAVLRPEVEHQGLDFWLSAMVADSGSSELRTNGHAEPAAENAAAQRDGLLGNDGSALLRGDGSSDAAPRASGPRTQRRRSGGRTPRRHLVQSQAFLSNWQEDTKSWLRGAQVEKENAAMEESTPGKAETSSGVIQSPLAAHNERMPEMSDWGDKSEVHGEAATREPEQDTLSVQEAVREQRSQEIIQTAFEVLRKLIKHKLAWPFMEPVDAVALDIPDYHDVIECPMDLGTIRDRLSGASPNAFRPYESADEVANDIRLVFDNAMRYNRADTQVHKWACTLRTLFDKMWMGQVEHRMREAQCRRQMQCGGSATAQMTESALHRECIDATELEMGTDGDRAGGDGAREAPSVPGGDGAREAPSVPGPVEPQMGKGGSGTEAAHGRASGEDGGGAVCAEPFPGANQAAGSTRAQTTSCLEVGDVGDAENDEDSDGEDALDDQLAEMALQAEEEALVLSQQAQALRTEILTVKGEAAALCREMAAGEKCQLAHDISALEPADLGLVVALIRSEEPQHSARRSSGKRKWGAGRTWGGAEWEDDDEMEIHFDALGNSTLWLLRHLVVSLST